MQSIRDIVSFFTALFFKQITYSYRFAIFLVAPGSAKETDWQTIIQIIPVDIKLIVFKSVRGGKYISRDKGDICIDNIYVFKGDCRESELSIYIEVFGAF